MLVQEPATTLPLHSHPQQLCAEIPISISVLMLLSCHLRSLGMVVVPE